MTVTLYDLAATTLPKDPLSPNTRKARYCLNYKRIPYKTQWVEYADIEPLFKTLGIAPTSKKPDGSALYTVPAIYDPATGAYVSDSFAIAQYLDKTYPDTPKIFPSGTVSLQAAFDDAFIGNLGAMWGFVLLAAATKLSPASEEFYRRTRRETFGKALEEMVPKGDEAVKAWKAFEAGLGMVDAWYQRGEGKGVYLLGNTPSWGDFVVVSVLNALRTLWGEESKKWKDVLLWHGGRWKARAGSLKEFETIL
ncbi:hypothetical protein NLJ89_g4436 [Agrocybe chaxingu]|uniref:GST N-terminal domain-containing protein n=1 Tax=Agrocybe chaxingu TaxID=84603 RepID=A0A9W8MWJ0_9AGAR|nr:hypothetical protein NLJ89_g4436 [Agrocybe chaxingu]